MSASRAAGASSASIPFSSLTRDEHDAVIYLRGTPVSVDRQRVECLQLAKRLGLSVVDILTEQNGRLGGPAFRQLLAEIGAGVTPIVYALDRLYRMPTQMEQLLGAMSHAGSSRKPIETVAHGTVDTANDVSAILMRMLAWDAERQACSMQARSALARSTRAAQVPQ